MTTPAAPLNLLLATDLSGRCDRAQARAAQLAADLSARLLVVHAVAPEPDTPPGRAQALPSARRTESRAVAADRRLRSDLQADGINATVLVAEGSPAVVVLDAVRRHHAGLVISGLARDDAPDRVQLGSTVDTLLQDLPVPLLTVRRRVRGPYRHVVVACDFSAASQAALQAALRWFDGRLTLFHAYDAPGGGLPGDHTVNRNWEQLAQQQCDQFLAQAALPGNAAARLRRVLALGHPEILLRDLVRQEEVDLVVLGTRGRTGLMKALLGSTAEALLHALDCDTLVVRGG